MTETHRLLIAIVSIGMYMLWVAVLFFKHRKQYNYVGGNHAEVEALNGYKGTLEQVTAYVTLEPCSFVGRTPACAVTLVNTGIAKVVVAMLDPDPRNSGRGIAILEQAGVEVEVGVCGEEVSAFLTPYLGKS